jgi:hypothetical protein
MNEVGAGGEFFSFFNKLEPRLFMGKKASYYIILPTVLFLPVYSCVTSAQGGYIIYSSYLSQPWTDSPTSAPL